MPRQKAFSLIETLVVIAIIGTLAVIILPSLTGARARARDAKRKAEISQIGRLLAGSCYLPNAGSGDYDLLQLADELKTKYPQYANFLSQIPKDPRAGTDSQSYYRYIVSADAKKCAFYANLENSDEPVTLTGIGSPTAGGGTGIFQAASTGWNNSTRYFQVSN